MSGDNIGRCNAAPDGNSGAVNSRDVYAYSGRDGSNGANNSGSGDARDPYRFAGEGGANGQHGQGHGDQAGQGTSADCNWRPDYSYSSPHARAWLQASREQATHPIERDSNGLYTVQFGDSLSGIAAREIRAAGYQGKIDQSQIKDEVGRIVQANDQTYPSLDCNKDLIKDGWKLQVPRWQPHLPAQSDRQPDRQTAAGPGEGDDQSPRCVQRPRDQQSSNYYDQPHQPRTIVNNYYIQTANFYQGGSSGFSTNQFDRAPNPGNDNRYRFDGASGNADNRYSYDGSGAQPRFQVRIPEYRPYQIAPTNGYGWERGACQSCHDNNNGQQWSTYGQDPRQSWIQLGGRQQGHHGQGSVTFRANFPGNNYSGNGYTSNDGYSVQTVPYNPANGFSVRTLPYNPASGYRIQPVAYNTADSGNNRSYTTNNPDYTGDNTYTY